MLPFLFYDGETEGQRRDVICLRPHRKSGVHNPHMGPEARRGWRVDAFLKQVITSLCLTFLI